MKEINKTFNRMEEHLNAIGLPSRDIVDPMVRVSNIENKYNISFPELYKLFVLKYGNSIFNESVTYNSIELSPCADKNGLSTLILFWF